MATTKKFRVKHGLDAGNNTISFVNDPVSANDAATKNYVDTQVSSGISGIANTSTSSATFTKANNTIVFTRDDGSDFDVVLTDVGEVSNAYLTSTFTTNTVFQSALANTNLAVSDRIQVSNLNATLASYWPSANVITYVDTEVAALVNSAPTTLDTLNELAAALGDDPNFATTLTTNLGQKLGASATVTLTGDVTGSGSFSSNAVSIALTDTNLGNTNLAIADRMQVANVISYTAKYLEVANVAAAVANTSTSNATYTVANSTITFTRADSSTFDVVVDSASVEVSNTAPSSPNEGDMWWDSATGELYIYYGTSWVEAVAQDVTPYANNGTFSSSNNTITFTRTDGSQFDVVLTGVGEVTNAYVTSTFTTNTVFQSALANTNAYIATKTDDTTVLATNTALRTLINDRIQVANVTGTYVTNTVFQSALANTNAYIATKTDDTVVLATNTALRTLIDDRIQVANADAKYATWTSLTSTNTAIRSYVDTEIAALVNSAPTTLDTLDELANALGDDANFSTTVLTLVGTKASNATLTSTYVTNTVFQSALANTNSYIATKTDDTTVLATNTALRTLISDRIQVANLNTTLADYWPSANVITYTAKYLEVANSSTGTSVTVSNSAPTITSNGELWWDNSVGELYVAYSNNWVEAVAQDVTPYANNGTFSSSNNTITFVRTDGSQFDVVLTGVGEVTNAYVTSTYTTNTVFQSALANTNAYIATKTDDSTVLATNTALRTLIDDRIQVANVTGTYVTNTVFQSALANTNSYIATKTDDTVVLATNTALRTLIDDRMQVANVNVLVNDRLQVANADAKYATWSSLTSTNTAIRSYVDTEVAALVNSAPVTLNTLNELADALGDDPNFATTLTTNLGQKLGATASVTLTGDVTGTASFSSNSLSLATTDTNLANTNAYIATKTDDTTVLATNTALRTLISDRVQVANLNTTLADYWPSANIITYTAKYLEVANSSSGTSLTVSNTAPSITANGELWWDNSVGELYVSYSNNWVEAVAQDVTPYTNNVSYSTSNTTLTFTRTDASQFDVFLDLSGVSGEVSNSYLTSTFVTNTDFQSALANTNAFIATKTDDTVALATNTALRSLISDRMQVANVEAYLANTNSYIATESARIDLVNTNLTGTNTALRTLISDRIQVANADSKYATWSSLTSTNTAIRAYVDTEVAALVNSAPTTLNTLDELASALGDDANFSTTVLTLIGSKASNSAVTSTYVTNTVFQSALANTNSYIATKTDDTVALATNTALRTLISDRLQVANAAYVTANTISVKNPANYHLYTVTVNTKTSAHPYSGSGSSSAYFLDGVESPSIILAPNQTYRFDQSDSTNSSHPLDFYVDAAKNTSYTTGVTVSGTAGSSGAYTEIVVDEDTPQVLYYQCQSHGYMGSVASILSDTSPKYMEVANTTSFITSTSLTPYLEVANSTSFITSTALTPYLEVANVATELADYWPSANIIAYTAKYLEVANNTGGSGSSLEVSNTAPASPSEGDMWYDTDTGIINIYVGTAWVESTVNLYAGGLNDYLQVANVASNTSTTSATLSGNTATFTRADSSTFTLDLSGIASSGGGGGGASVTVANTAPGSASEGDLYFDNELATMFIYYDSSWVEVQPTIDPINPLTYGVDTFTANGTATDFTHTSETVSADAMLVTVDGIIQRPTTDYTVSSKTVTFGTAPANTSIVAVRVTTGAFTGVSNATFQSALANTNAYIASLSGSSYQEVTSNTTMVAGTKYIVGTRTANVVLTFPTSASLGDEIRILDGTGQANAYGIELSRNGHRIQGQLANVIIDTSRAAGGYVYYNANNGWILTEV